MGSNADSFRDRRTTTECDSRLSRSPGLSQVGCPDRVSVWGVPFAPWTMGQTIAAIGELIRAGRPSHVIAANTHYAMLCEQDPELRAINSRVAFIVADGMPLVWASWFGNSPLPERVAGSDLLFEFSAEASLKGYRLFLMGGAEGVAEAAAKRLTELYPGLQVAGTASPPFRDWTAQEEADLIAAIRSARPDFLVTALTMPRGDRWLADNIEALGIPVVFNGGAAADFAAGRKPRAPRVLRRTGFEWAFRLWMEPRRLGQRYKQDLWFIARVVSKGSWGAVWHALKRR